MLKLKTLNRPLKKFTTSTSKITLPLFSEEVNDFCIKHNITNECIRFYELINETFINIDDISVSVSEDYEIENFQDINFIITLSDEIDNILRLDVISLIKPTQIAPNYSQ